jgi:hypothetical protein
VKIGRSLEPLEIGRKIYRFQEDHGFYIDGWSTAGLHDVAMVCVAAYGLQIAEAADDVFFSTLRTGRGDGIPG